MTGLSVIGIDPWTLFGLFSSFILGFSFMISGASSNYFKGILFILVQRPVSSIALMSLTDIDA